MSRHDNFSWRKKPPFLFLKNRLMLYNDYHWKVYYKNRLKANEFWRRTPYIK